MENHAKLDDYEQIDLRELFDVAWSGRLVIVIFVIVFAFGSLVYSLSIPNQYKATVLLAPAKSDGGGLSSALGELSGLASLAGVSIEGADISESRIAQEIMNSWGFIDSFINKHNLAVEIYAAEGWDETLDSLKINSEVYDNANKMWLDVNGEGPKRPSSWELFERFSEILSVSESSQTGLVTVSIEYYSPVMAKQWVDLYVAAINEHMQERQVTKVASNISYLEAQIAKTSVAEMREVFFTIIEEQTKNKMVAEASPDYAFVAVSTSMVPEEKSQPARALICIFGTFLGGVLGLILVLVRHFNKQQ